MHESKSILTHQRVVWSGFDGSRHTSIKAGTQKIPIEGSRYFQTGRGMPGKMFNNARNMYISRENFVPGLMVVAISVCDKFRCKNMFRKFIFGDVERNTGYKKMYSKIGSNDSKNFANAENLNKPMGTMSEHETLPEWL